MPDAGNVAGQDPYQRFSLKGKVALVTGAAGGLGRAICEAFTLAGASVACVDANLPAVESVAQALRALGGRALALAADVADHEAVHRTVGRCVAELGAPTILLSGAAGSDPDGSVLDYSLDQWNRVMAVNINGAFLFSKAVIPHMAQAGGGSIILLASQLGTVAAPRRVAYCTSKAALIHMASAMAADHASQSIRVNSLSPGAVETSRLEFRFGSMEEARRIAGPRHLLGRLGLPVEIGSAALFLASDASSFMTGADLLVDGGYVAT